MASKPITWEYRKVKVSEIKDHPDNARMITSEKLDHLTQLITDIGFNQPCVVNTDMTCIAGHQRKKSVLAKDGPDGIIDIAYPSRTLTPEEVERLLIGDNLFRGAWDPVKLREVYPQDKLLKLGFQQNELNLIDKLKTPSLGAGVADKITNSSVNVQVEKTQNEKPVFTVVIECTDPDHQKRIRNWLAEHGYESQSITT